MSTPSGRSLPVKPQEPRTQMSLAQMRCQLVSIAPPSVERPNPNIAAAAAKEFDAPGPRDGRPGAAHHQLGPEPADKISHGLDARGRRCVLFDIHRRLRTEFARERKPRRLRSTDADDAAGS